MLLRLPRLTPERDYFVYEGINLRSVFGELRVGRETWREAAMQVCACVHYQLSLSMMDKIPLTSAFCLISHSNHTTLPQHTGFS